MEEFDILILGTGLTESILSLKLSKSNKILHIDKNDTYGSQFQSLTYQQIVKKYNSKLIPELLNKQFLIDNIPKVLLSNGKIINLLENYNLTEYLNFALIPGNYVFTDRIYHIPTSERDCLEFGLISFWQKPKFIKFMWNIRKYNNLDYSNNTGIDNNINSKDNKKDNINTSINNKDKYLDNNKNNINNSKDNLNSSKDNINSNTNYKNNINNSVNTNNKNKIHFESTTEKQFKYFGINNELRDLIGHCVALNLDDEYLNEHPEILYKKISLYVNSINYFNGFYSPYIYPLYGLSEFSQCLCRKSALNGTVFRLNTPVVEIVGNGFYFKEERDNRKEDNKEDNKKEDNKKEDSRKENNNLMEENNRFMKENGGKEDNNKEDNSLVNNIIKEDNRYIVTLYDPLTKHNIKIKTKYIISDPSYFPKLTKIKNKVIRCTCIIKGELKIIPKSISSQIIFLSKYFNRKNDIFVLILSEKEYVTPEGYYVVLISTVIETNNPENEIEFVIKKLGNVVQKFYEVSDMMEGFNNDRIFVTDSVDHTSSLESVLEYSDRLWGEIEKCMKGF